MTKSIACRYPSNNTNGGRSKIQNSEDAQTELRKTTTSSKANNPGVGDHQEASNDDTVVDTGLVLSESDFASIGWDAAEIEFPSLLDPQTIDGSIKSPSSGSRSSATDPLPSAEQIIQIQQAISLYNVRSLILRPKVRSGGQRITNLILQTLISYPRIILQHNTLPPFIHPQSLSFDNDTEPLANCISLMRMISRGARESRKLFWKNVRLECERFCDEVRLKFRFL